MRKAHAFTVYAAAAGTSLLMAWENENLLHWWSPLLTAPFALLVSGLLALLLLGPHLRASGSARLRLTHHLLCGLAFGMVLVESVLRSGFLLDGDVTALDASRFGMHVFLVATAGGVLLPAWRVLPPAERRTLAAASAGFTLALLAGALAPVVAAATVTLQAVAFLGLAGFRRTGREVARAGLAAAAVLAGGFMLLLAGFGSSWVPPKLVLDAHLGRALGLPILAAAAFTFVVVLVLRPGKTAPPTVD